uniref:Uncharacterized protein n=1 Tax=Globodera rostochiensis TaxID=31243 RepID=A0A914HS86_GLORO
MNDFGILIFVSVFATNSLDKTESVQLEETPINPLDEIFGEGWWDNEKDEEWNKLTLEQTFHYQIDRQNIQLGQIEPNSTDQNPPLTVSDHFGQIEPNSTDQNPPLTVSDHFGQIEPNSTDQTDHSGQIEPNSTDQNPPLTVSDHFGQIEPNSTDQNPPLTVSDHFGQIEPNSTDQTDHSGQIEPNSTDQNPPLTESDHSENAKNGEELIAEDEQKQKFDQMKAELKRDGLKTSYCHEIDETVAKELGPSVRTISNWKRKLGQTKPQHKHSHSEQKELMKCYYEIKDKNPKIRDVDITKMLKIGTSTLVNWKSLFKRQQFRSNSVDSVEENAGSNVPEIGNSNSEI